MGTPFRLPGDKRQDAPIRRELKAYEIIARAPMDLSGPSGIAHEIEDIAPNRRMLPKQEDGHTPCLAANEAVSLCNDSTQDLTKEAADRLWREAIRISCMSPSSTILRMKRDPGCIVKDFSRITMRRLEIGTEFRNIRVGERIDGLFEKEVAISPRSRSG